MADVSLLNVWEAMLPLNDREIDNKTRNCLRMKSMVVTTAYNSITKTVGVSEPFGNEVQLPVYGGLDVSALTVNTAVWVALPYSSMSNAIVFMLGDGSGTIAEKFLDISHPVGSVYLTTDVSDPSTTIGGTWTLITSSFTIGMETVSAWKRTA